MRRTNVNSKLTGVLLIATMAFGMMQPSVHAQVAVSPSPTAAGEDSRAKIHPDLLQDIEQATSTGGPSVSNAMPRTFDFVARVRDGVDLSDYTGKWFTRPFIDASGMTVAVGTATASSLFKIAALPDVAAIQRPESLIRPLGEPVTEPAQGPVLNDAFTPSGRYDALDIHHSQAAWQAGYTGAGVSILINDSGADYCHPDLQGTWATVQDPSSAYFGLPVMFDSYSAFLAAQDYRLGTRNIANGLADYADTSTVVTGPAASFRPLGAPVARTYTLPGTSRSGVYHIGSHPDRGLANRAPELSQQYGDGSAELGERAAVLVVDETTDGVYDTVYVDLNYNYTFADDTPARLDRSFQNRETACYDANGDGLNDVSGGLVYFIADGQTPLPTVGAYWGIPGSAYGNGNLVAFHVLDTTEPGGSHGMSCTVAAVGRGVLGAAGPGKDAKTVQNGNVYLSPFVEDAIVFAGRGYNNTTRELVYNDDIPIVSNSWGVSTYENVSLDAFSRRLALAQEAYAPRTAVLFAAGNGGPGYSTLVSPRPATAISVGASTLFGEDSIFAPVGSAAQTNGGDVVSWSARGPALTGGAGVDIIATGTDGASAVPLNSVLDGAAASGRFQGTSRAAPIAAGNIALVLQAWKASGRDTETPWPRYDGGLNALIRNATRDANHDAYTQGAGIVDALRGVQIASQQGGVEVLPTTWTAGGYQGQKYAAFPSILTRSASEDQRFTFTNYQPVSVQLTLRGVRFDRINQRTFSVTTADQALDHGELTVPDYIYRIDGPFADRTDLLQVRMVQPYSQFDPNDDQNEPFNAWQLALYNWTDRDGDGSFWNDADANGKVSVIRGDAGQVISSEMELNEYGLVNYSDTLGPTQQVRMAAPLRRMDDGLLLGLRHTATLSSVPTTTLRVNITAWEKQDWLWLDLNRTSLTLQPGQSVDVNARLRVPTFAPFGLYEGAIEATYTPLGGNDRTPTTVSVPVTTMVAANRLPVDYGAKGPGFAPQLYNNSQMYGATDYSWRQESGDWRTLYVDVPQSAIPATGTSYLVVDNRWFTAATDIDTTILGPTRDCFSNGIACSDLFGPVSPRQNLFGPYTLDTVARSINRYQGDGRWAFDTSSGGAREFVATPAVAGLHAIQLHQVKSGEYRLNEPVGGRVGLVTLAPGLLRTTGISGTAGISVTSQLFLDGFSAEGYGLNTTSVTTEEIRQDIPDQPGSAAFRQTLNVQHASALTIRLDNYDQASDIDLYLYGPDGQLAGTSVRPRGAVEQIVLDFPADGAYTLLVHGYSVPAGSTPARLTVDLVQGNDLAVSIEPTYISPNAPGVLRLRWNLEGRPAGVYRGTVILGPSRAPALFRVPVEIIVP